MGPQPGQHTEDGDEALSINPQNGEREASMDAPTRELPAALAQTRELTAVPAIASGDRCSACGAPLAHDQRYCVECGERRGQSTIPKAAPPAEARGSRARTRKASRPPRVSSGATLVSGVGVLLLAIGLGVLIGHLANSTPTQKAAAPPPQVITVQASGSGPATTATTAVPKTPTHVSKKAQSKLNAAAKATAPPPAAVQKKAVQAAGKVLGNSNNLAPPTVTTGQTCSASQAGCSGGTFNGNFFGQ